MMIITMGFQGHMHPDDWRHTWHDTAWMIIL